MIVRGEGASLKGRGVLFWAAVAAGVALIGPALLSGEGLLATAALW